MKFTHFLVTLAPLAHAALNGPCAGSAHPRSICLEISTCKAYGGSRFVGGCPGTPDDVECCTINGCDSVNSFCTWTGTPDNNQCADVPGGVFVKDHCPGPSDYECCVYGLG